MKLITPEFEKLIEEYPLYSQENSKDPIVSIKLFIGSATWYLTEYDKDSKTAFGLTIGLGDDEFGYIHIPELEEIRAHGVFEVERDLYLKPGQELTSLLDGDTRAKIKSLLGHKS